MNATSSESGHQQPVTTALDAEPRIQLLVSVKDAAEAELCLQHHVDWIDLKNPDAGPLGAPTLAIARPVADALGHQQQRSVALGELCDLQPNVVEQLARWFPIVKVGLAGRPSNSGVPSQTESAPEWRDRLVRLATQVQDWGARLVPVIYGDWSSCGAPAPQQVIDVAAELQSPYVLLDTYDKQRSHLLDWLSIAEITTICRRLRPQGTQVVAAGRLSEHQWPQLQALPIAAIGVRGAVCSGPRTGRVCARKLQSWTHRVQST